jgi:putative IMPACT (imprinted ancient) family translation regulator
MVYFPLRLPTEVMKFFDAYPNRNAKIREVLASYIQQQGEANENSKQEVTEVK